MKLPSFLLDHWLAAHEFASPPIRFNLASSTGPTWTLGQLLALGGEAARDELDGIRLSYAPPEGSKLLRSASVSSMASTRIGWSSPPARRRRCR